MIEKIPFGNTGHLSTRTIFGAAGLGSMRQDKADSVLEVLLEHGVNHIDTAASYGESELRIGPWMREHRSTFFVASKTGERTRDKARESLHRSLERLQIDRLDLIQMHNLVAERDRETALGDGGALEALVEARDEGLVRFIGVTGHGSFVAARHRASLERFAFDAVLLPYNYSMMQQAEYAADFEALYATCRDRGVAMQTIKGIAHRRWTDDDTDPHFSWYRPIKDADALRRAVHYVLARDGLFLNTSSDVTLLGNVLEAAAAPLEPPSDEAMAADVDALGIEALFIRGVTDEI